MTLGDIMAILAALFILGASWTAAILLVSLAFHVRVERAQAMLTSSPGKCALRGLGTLLVGGFLAITLYNAPAGPAKLLAGAIMGGLGVLASLGSAAMVRMLADRIDALGSPMTPFSSLTRASVLYVSAGFLPVIGWFFLMPSALLLAVGSAVAVLKSSAKATSIVPAFDSHSAQEITA